MLLIGNGRLITKDEHNTYFDNGAVLLKDGKVLEIGETNDLKEKYTDCDWLDAKGKVIMPGFINTHMHIYSAFARGMPSRGLPPKNFVEILETLWWRLDRALSLDYTKYSAYTTLIDSIKCGVTTVFDHHASGHHVEGSLFTIADVAKELGIRVNLCYETSDRNGAEIIRESIKENVEFIRCYNQKDQNMIKGMFGLHASFTLSDDTLNACAEEMESLNAGYHIHVAEGIEDLQDCLKKYGKRLVNRLYDFNITGEKSIFVHGIYLNDREMDLVKETNTFMAHNPESNMGNAVGTSPVIHMMKKGLLVGLGTDGYTSDMLESMKVANIIHKHHLNDSNVGWTEVPKMVHENNPHIMSKYFDHPGGVLKKGALGDVIIVNYDPLTPMNQANLNSHILFGMSGALVTDTIIDGKIIMKDRKLLHIDEASIFARSREQAEKLWANV